MSVGQSLPGHAEGILLFVRLIQRFHQLCAQHDDIDAVGLADNVGIAGKSQPVLVIARISQIHSLDGVARHHQAVFLKILHACSKGVDVAVGVILAQG